MRRCTEKLLCTGVHTYLYIYMCVCMSMGKEGKAVVSPVSTSCASSSTIFGPFVWREVEREVRSDQVVRSTSLSAALGA